jgi:2-polyprenyl-3-methyl-5-hydroxy-6-metoxy-1,4-benzoquinol methylase
LKQGKDVKMNQSYELHKKARVTHWENTFSKNRKYPFSKYYHSRLSQVYKFIIPPGSCVLEFGCGNGRLLGSLNPSRGVGVDFSAEAVKLARAAYPHLEFHTADIHEWETTEKFDYILLSDIVNDLWNVQKVLEKTINLCKPSTRVIINTYSKVWDIPLSIASSCRLATPVLKQNWLTPDDIRNLLHLSGYETLRCWREILFPIYFPILTSVFNKWIARLWPFNNFCLTNFIVARPLLSDSIRKNPPKVSIIVPARNEAGNIDNILKRVPELGSGTEIVFVEGNSTDNTYEAIKSALENYPHRECQLHSQSGKGKGDAVRLGFEKATGDLLMILDADLTVEPEELGKFYTAIVSGKAEFANGVRLVYPMQDRAMRFFNLLGNKFFSVFFSWLLGQPVKDTLCGTKVLYKSDYEKIRNNRSYFGDFDPFGDFDLLFGASKLNMRIVDIPIRYAERSYGTTNISRWKHGFLLLRMAAIASKRLKFM